MNRGTKRRLRSGSWMRRCSVVAGSITLLIAGDVPGAGAASTTPPPLSALAGETAPNNELKVVVAAAALLLLLAVAVFRLTMQRSARRTSAAASVTGPYDDHGVQRRLSVINAWARTLDDRWSTMSESDKRVAMQIIRRNTEEALGDLPELLASA